MRTTDAGWAGRWWRVVPDVGRDARPILWLALGILASFVYLDAAAFTSLLTINLPLPLFAPQAVILSVLLLTRRERWWLYLAAYYAMQVAEGIWSNLSLPYILSSNLANVIEPLVGAALFRTFVPRPRLFSRLSDASIYVACVSFGALIGATWGASMRAIVGFPFWQSWTGWFLGDVLASLVLAPMIVLWASAGIHRLRLTTRMRVVEAVSLVLAFVVVGLFVFTRQSADPDAAPALLYLLVPLLVWSAVRFGPQGLMTALAIVTAMAIAGVVNDMGPFEGRSSPANLFSLQLFLMGVGVPLLLMAALVLEQQDTQTRLAQSEKRYRVIVRSLPHDAVLVFGSDLRHSFAGGGVLSDLGVLKQAVEGRTLHEVFSNELSTALEAGYRAALAGKHVSFDLVHADRDYQVDVLPMPEVSGPTGMLVIHDVSENKRAEILVELDRAKTVFFDNVSHELRTPLTLVLGPIKDALASGALSGPKLELVHRNAERLHRLVDALLDLARIDAGHLIASYQLTDVAALTADLASNFRSAIETAGLRLIVQTPPLPGDMQVYLDREMWETVVLNLISNAYKHTFVGEIRVNLSASADHQHMELVVQDTGIGIPASEQARVFDRFHRVEGARSRTSEGSGIGLALVQEIVRLHGGHVTVTSLEAGGSAFTVRLPVGSRDIAPEQIIAPTPLSSSATGGAARYVADATTPAELLERPTQTSLGRVLIADDNRDMQRYVADILSENWTVQAVRDGESALEAIQQGPPDIVLLDVTMPGLSGFEVLARLRENAATRRLPVIILSARAGGEAAVEALVAGANDYLGKPFAAAELAARVRTQVDAARARVEAEAALRHRDEFVAIVVHDLRHPLTAVNWHVQVLQRQVDRGETPTKEGLLELLRIIEMSVRRLSAQIDELHDATRLQAGRALDLQLRSTDLVELVRNVVQQDPQPRDRLRLHFETELAKLTGAWDGARLERVIANLLSNAVKFSPNGDDITVRVARDAEWVVLSVEDHGLGIPATDLPRIFNRYSRGSNVTGRIGGSGLGLSGAKGIVEQHGGTITVESTEGKGSTFVVRLPLSREW
jgi:signal transduction histidine kinase